MTSQINFTTYTHFLVINEQIMMKANAPSEEFKDYNC